MIYTYITKESKAPTKIYFYTYEKAIEKVKDLRGKLNSQNCELVLFSFGEYNNNLANVYRKEGIELIELRLRERLNNLPVNSKLEGHLNEIGHSIVAERLFSQLILNELIPKEYLKTK